MDPGGAVKGLRLALHWAWAGRPLPGMPVSGDALWVARDGQRFEAAVMDGLGHGREAAEASAAACATLESIAGATLADKVDALHRDLRRSRGVALALLEVDLAARSLAWCGIGNILGLLVGDGRDERLLSSNGIVGLGLPSQIRIKSHELRPGDRLLLATDGLREDLARGRDAWPPGEPGALAEDLLARHARRDDDALVWVGVAHD